MILADKIIEERKRNNWSQEELAEKLDVSRQAVSKWEGAQSVPDLQKILIMSNLFGVSTDYLLKDDIEGAEYIETEEKANKVKKVSMEEANNFLEMTEKSAPQIALAVLICVLSPICLLTLGAVSETGAITENVACGIGMTVLFLFIACAVAIFISNGRRMSKYEYLEHDVIETAYGVSGMVNEKKQKYEPVYSRDIIVGVVLAIVGVISLFIAPVLSESDVAAVIAVDILLAFEAVAAFIFVRSGSIQSSYSKLLQDGDYKVIEKKDTVIRLFSTVYWLIITAVFLGYSFVTNDWNRSWIVWPVSGVLFPAMVGIIKLIRKDYDNK